MVEHPSLKAIMGSNPTGEGWGEGIFLFSSFPAHPPKEGAEAILLVNSKGEKKDKNKKRSNTRRGIRTQDSSLSVGCFIIIIVRTYRSYLLHF